MIDLGLTKLAVIGAVALIVIGPKDLPRVARMAGTLLGRAQRYISQVKTEVNREIEMEELRKMQQEVQSAAQEIEQSVHKELSEAQQELNSIASPGQDYSYSYHDRQYALEALAEKAKDFRRKKLAKTSNVPSWYKSRHGQRTRVMSGAARMAKHRVKSANPSSFF
ncbi:Sec-independent protein translocase subunit TatB [Undibacterium sp. LX40W]|uniref:Sec-independent protein translocase protein TatB n=1 Tax=Undibacterium nitidum TaxID=2762298 RepID=A0A923KM42_9BURK|nr:MULTISPECIES: Sec-independent protein translocase protein TatB [Undibacterium]MBC3882510.1 Sec-independent protein translocase subunit TatB [Undibacterium nitidum]MBC3892791.1 Sec-independent protein translocase subunit TatB [Undibacterium sp. LX40W]